MTDAKVPGLEERFAEIKGVRMRYFVGGDGPPLMLVHGLGGAASNWTELAPLLLERHRLLVPDLPGHGGSTALPAVSGLEPFADRVALLAEREGMLPAVVAGHSLGGMVVLRLALRRDDPRQELEAVRCPVLVLWGAEDVQLPLDDAFEYTRRLRARLRVIPGCGHLLIGERPEACADAIERFLRDGGFERHHLPA